MTATFEKRPGSPGYIWATLENGNIIELYPQYDRPVTVAKKAAITTEEAESLLKQAVEYSCRPTIAKSVQQVAPAHQASKLNESDLDAKMRAAGFEAAGNGAGLWNRLNPIGNDF